MRKIDLGQTIQILANIAVIAGIVFLAAEIRQNNELMAADARFNRLQIVVESNTLIAENASFAELVARTDQTTETLTAGEREQMLNFGKRVLLNQQWTFSELPPGELPIEEWRRVSKRGYWQLVWEERRGDLRPDFVTWVEQNVLLGE